MFDAERLEALFKKRGRTYRHGDVIFMEEDVGEEVFIVVSGRVEISKTFKERELFGTSEITIGRTTDVLAVLGPGEILGEMAILDDQPRVATARAVGDVRVIAMNRSEMEKMLESQPAIAVQMLKTLSSRLREADKSPRLESVLPMIRDLLKNWMSRRPSKVGGETKPRTPRPKPPLFAPPATPAAASTAASASSANTQGAGAGMTVRLCSGCDRAARPDDRFCAWCGTKLPS